MERTRKTSLAARAAAVILLLPLLLAACSAGTARAADALTWEERGGETYLCWDPADADGIVLDVVLPDGTAVSFDLPTGTSYFPVGNVVSAGGEYVFRLFLMHDGERTPAGETSRTFTLTLDSPSGLKKEGERVTWTTVAGATRYEVSLNGIPLGETENTFFDLEALLLTDCECTFSVTALGDKHNLSSTPATLRFSFVGAPFPPYDILLAKHDGHFLLTWTPITDYAPISYVYSVKFEDEAPISATSDTNSDDVTALFERDGSYVVAVKTVRGGRESVSFKKTFVLSDGEVTA